MIPIRIDILRDKYEHSEKVKEKLWSYLSGEFLFMMPSKFEMTIDFTDFVTSRQIIKRSEIMIMKEGESVDLPHGGLIL